MQHLGTLCNIACQCCGKWKAEESVRLSDEDILALNFFVFQLCLLLYLPCISWCILVVM